MRSGQNLLLIASVILLTGLSAAASGGSNTLYTSSVIDCGETLNQNNTGWRACKFQQDVSSGTTIKLPYNSSTDGFQPGANLTLIPARIFSYPSGSKINVSSKELGGVSYFHDNSQNGFAEWTLQQSWNSGEEIRFAFGRVTEFGSGGGSKSVEVKFDSVAGTLKMNFTGIKKYGGDGDNDVVWMDDNLGYVWTTDSSMTKNQTSYTSRDLTQVRDFVNWDGDDRIEFFALRNGNIIIIEQDGSVTDTGYDANDVGGMGDIDSDGVQELMYSSSNGYLLGVDKNGQVTNTTYSGIWQIGDTCDIDNDGTPETLIKAQSGNGYDIGMVSPSGTFTALFGDGDALGGCGDWDGDGVPETLGDPSNNQDLQIFDGSGTTTNIWLNGASILGGVIGDFDGDGDVDAVASRYNEYGSYKETLAFTDGTNNVVAPDNSDWDVHSMTTRFADIGGLNTLDPSASFGSQFWSFTGTFSGSDQSSDFSSQVSSGVNTMTLSSNQKGKLAYFVTYKSENQAPDEPFNPSPSDGAGQVSTSPTLSVNVTDPNGDTMDVYFYDASDDSKIGEELNVANGSIANTTWSGLNNQQTYSWYVNVTDGSLTTMGPTWSFSTADKAPVIDSTSPQGQNRNPNSGVELSAKVGEPNREKMNVTFYDASDDSQIGKVKNVNNGTYSVSWTGLSADQTYSYYVEVTDGNTVTTGSTHSFTTIDVTLNWNDQSSNEAGFRIYSNATGTLKQIATVGENTETATVYNSGLDFNENTTYKVSAYNQYGESSKLKGYFTP